MTQPGGRFSGTRGWFQAPNTEGAVLPWPNGLGASSTKALSESLEVKRNIIPEMTKKMPIDPTCYFQFSSDDRKRRHTQKLKEKQI